MSSFFFFSSRRRHTRCYRDWSSDVCSSDLSKILALSARQMPHDWQTRYGHRPLLETLVDADRFRGTCYRAANWAYLGPTAGRGRMDREHKAHGQAIKDIYVYPLVRDARQRLRCDPMR